ncbi:MAG: hypothetical protein ACE5H4_15405 [Candidatus Thorarchaeota archaeon]
MGDDKLSSFIRCKHCEFWEDRYCSLTRRPDGDCPLNKGTRVWGFKTEDVWEFFASKEQANLNAEGKRVVEKDLFDAVGLVKRANLWDFMLKLERHDWEAKKERKPKPKQYPVQEFSLEHLKRAIEGEEYGGFADNERVHIKTVKFECDGEVYGVSVFWVFPETLHEYGMEDPPREGMYAFEILRQDERESRLTGPFVSIDGFYKDVPEDGCLEIEVKDRERVIPIRLSGLMTKEEATRPGPFPWDI